MWIGSVVHSCIERSVKNIYRGIKPLDTERILQITLKMMKGDFVSSQRKRYLREPKTCALFEHEYDIDVGKEEWDRVFDSVEKHIRTFYESEVYQEICSLPKENWLEVEEFSHFLLDNVKVWAVLDFAFKDGKDVIIYDWKTGRSEKKERDNVQLACYALYAMGKWKVPADNIRTREYNLARNEIHEFPVENAIIEGVKEYIRGSVRDMKELLLDKESNAAVESDFPKTTDENTCLKCNFKRVCREMQNIL
jgi:CRISPR/Cas system-associated exonuclease Cas4 (RecB family)